MLNLTQQQLGELVGTSRQQIIKFEQQEAKVTKSILIALVTYCSLKPITARFLHSLSLYENKFVQSIGFTEQVIMLVINDNSESR
jgi:DNA-binding XRE family transcriptional regulator